MPSKGFRMGAALNKLLQDHGTDFVTSITYENGQFVLRLRPPRRGEAGGFTQILADHDSPQHKGACQVLANWLGERYHWKQPEVTTFYQALLQFAAKAKEGASLTYRDNKLTSQGL